MGKRRAAKQGGQEAKPQQPTALSENREQHYEKILATWTQREIQMKLQCSPDDAAMAAATIMSMEPKQLREWCSDLLSETEKHLDPDRRFYNQFMDKREELGLLPGQGGGAKTPGSAASSSSAAAASDASSVASTSASAATKGKKAQKYNKKVDIGATQDGKDALLPTSQECNCEARKHKLLTNCQLCGKIVCEQEGWGRCYFCGSELKEAAKPVKGKDDQDDEAYLAREREFLKAVAQRDKLLKFQDERSKRTTIVDDQEDYYSTTNPWLDSAELKVAAERERQEKEDRIKRNKRGGAYEVHLDFFSKSVEMVNDKDKAKDGAGGDAKPPPPRRRRDGEDDDPDPVPRRAIEAPIEKRQREGKEEDEENPDNILVGHNAVYGENVAAELAEVREEMEAAAEREEGRMVEGFRVMRNPAAKEALFDATAILQTWIYNKLREEYGFTDDDAEKDASSLARMTNLAAVRTWAQTHLTDKGIEHNFPAEYEAESHRVQMKQLRRHDEDDDRRGGGGGGDGADGEAEGKRKGKLQSDWEELAPEQKSSVEKLSVKKKKPWVLVNSPVAKKMDMVLGLKASGMAMCMSMHQPWASLLVCGIKKHEGRVWGTDFRGRLFIHAAAHQPTDEDISTVESFYAARGATVFPTHYPTSVLLGCVTVTDCLEHSEYEKKIPPAEQESKSEHVFICVNPQMLVLPLPMDGNHKIYPLEKGIVQAVRRQAGNRPEI